MATVDAVKQWLESQLETATLEGGNEFTPGTMIEEIDPAYDMSEVMAIVSDNSHVVFHIYVRNFD